MGRRRRLRAHVRGPGGECDAGLLDLRPPRPRPQAAPAPFGRAPGALQAGGRGAQEGGGREREAGKVFFFFVVVGGPREEAAAAEDGLEKAAEAERPERRRAIEVGVVGAPSLRKKERGKK